MKNGDTETGEIHKLRAENEAFRSVCQRLWPAVRFFGLCGADLRYIEAVAEMGQLIGATTPAAAGDTGELVAKARMETIGQVAELIRTSPEVLSLTGRGLRDKIAEMVANLRVQ